MSTVMTVRAAFLAALTTVGSSRDGFDPSGEAGSIWPKALSTLRHSDSFFRDPSAARPAQAPKRVKSREEGGGGRGEELLIICVEAKATYRSDNSLIQVSMACEASQRRKNRRRRRTRTRGRRRRVQDPTSERGGRDARCYETVTGVGVRLHIVGATTNSTTTINAVPVHDRSKA